MSLKTYFIFDSSIRDPLGLRYLFQVRVGLSSLRYHKIRHNFIYTPSDKCLCNQNIEGTNHFLRSTLTIDVTVILQQYDLTHLGNQSYLYLYWHRTLFRR